MTKSGYRWSPAVAVLTFFCVWSLAAPAQALVITTTADFPDDVDMVLSGTGARLTILAGSATASLEIGSNSFAVEVATGAHFTVRYPGPTSKTMPNDGGIADCNYVAGNNDITINGPTVAPITFIPSTLVNCTASGGSSGGGGGGGGGSVAPSLALSSPNGGETWRAGDSVTVFWAAGGSGISGIKLSLSTDGGMTYPTVLAASAYNSGALSWTVPDLATTSAMVKAEALGISGTAVATDTSNSVFTILGAPPAPLTVVMTAPPDTLAGTTTLTAQTSRRVDSLDFAIAGGAAPLVVAATPDAAGTTWTGIWNTKTSADGVYGVTAKAYLTAEQHAAATPEGQAGPVSVTVDNPNYTAAVAITQPVTGASVYRQTTLTATTSIRVDALRFTLTTVDSSVAGSIVVDAAAATTSGKTWNAAWDTRTAANGRYSLVADALTGGVVVGESDPQYVDVDNWPAAIAVTVFTPLSTQAEPKTAHLSATTDFAADRLVFVISSVGAASSVIASVDGEADAGGKQWTGEWDTANVEAGLYSVRAKALMDTTQLGLSRDVLFALPLAVPDAALTAEESAAPAADPGSSGNYSATAALGNTPTINLNLGLLTPPAATLMFRPGALIKGASSPAVYYYGRDAKRHVFPNERTFFSWFNDFSGVLTISDALLASIPIGVNVTYRPGDGMVKIQTDPKVYAVCRGGLLRWVTTEAVARILYGADWNTKIDDVPDAFFFNYTIGDPITEADAVASGGSL